MTIFRVSHEISEKANGLLNFTTLVVTNGTLLMLKHTHTYTKITCLSLSSQHYHHIKLRLSYKNEDNLLRAKKVFLYL